MSLFRVLYRQLLRLARQHDRHPTLKAMLEHPRRQWLLHSASAPLPAGARPLRVLPSPSGSGIILTGSLRSLQGPQLEKILRKLVRGEPMGEGAEEGEGEGEEAAEGEAESVDQAWARTVSPAQARWIHDFFRDADFYVCHACAEAIEGATVTAKCARGLTAHPLTVGSLFVCLSASDRSDGVHRAQRVSHAST